MPLDGKGFDTAERQGIMRTGLDMGMRRADFGEGSWGTVRTVRDQPGDKRIVVTGAQAGPSGLSASSKPQRMGQKPPRR